MDDLENLINSAAAGPETPPSREESNGRRHSGNSIPVSRLPAKRSAPRPEGADVRPALDGEDLWSLTEAVLLRWKWLLAWVIMFGAGGWALGWAHYHESYTAVVQLIRADSPTVGEYFHPRSYESQTLADLVSSPVVLQRIAARVHPPVPMDRLAQNLRLSPEHNSDITILVYDGDNAARVAEVANEAANETVQYTRDLQADEAREAKRYLEGQLADMDRQARNLTARFPAEPLPVATNGLAAETFTGAEPLEDRLAAAEEVMTSLLGSYTEAHPLVQEQQARIDALKRQLRKRLAGPRVMVKNAAVTGSPAAGTNNPTQGLAEGLLGREVVAGGLQGIENNRMTLEGRKRAIESFIANPTGYYQVIAPISTRDVVVHGRRVKLFTTAAVAALFGLVMAVGGVLLIELTEDRIKTVADVRRITRLPLLASLGDFDRLDVNSQKQWAFRTWTALQSHLTPSPNHGLVCGFTSSDHGEGRSLWVTLLAQAAKDRGFRVLTIATRPNSGPSESFEELGTPDELEPGVDDPGAVARTSALETPSEIADRLVAKEQPPLVHIPLPGWVWNLERRKQWRAALDHWSKIDNIAILVELPPASAPEAVLLAENLPNVVWLNQYGTASASKTFRYLTTLRHARCHLVGFVMNKIPSPGLRRLFPRWWNSAETIV